jgi:hypothetical protein
MRKFVFGLTVACAAYAVAAVVVLWPAARAQTAPGGGYVHFTSAVRMWADSSQVVIQANAIPNHKSP